MTTIPNPNYDTQYLQNKNPLGISSGFNQFAYTEPLYSLRSPLFDLFPYSDLFPSIDSFNPAWIIATAFPDWTPETVPDPEPDAGDYFKYWGAYFSANEHVYFMATLTEGSEENIFDLQCELTDTPAVSVLGFADCVSFAGFPDALFLKGYWTRSGHSVSLNPVQEYKMEKVQSEPVNFAENYLIKPYYKMGEYNIPRFRYFPEQWKEEIVEETAVQSIEFWYQQIGVGVEPEYKFVPDYSADTISDWIDSDTLKTIYKEKFNPAFIPTSELYSVATDTDKQLHNLKRNKTQNPQDVITGNLNDKLNNTFDMVLHFGAQDKANIIVKWKTIPDYYLDEAGERLTTEFPYFSQYIATGEFPLTEEMLEYNAAQTAETVPWYNLIEDSYTTDIVEDVNYSKRYYWYTLSYYFGMTPYYLRLRPDKVAAFQERIEEIHLGANREFIAEGFFWNCEKSKERVEI